MQRFVQHYFYYQLYQLVIRQGVVAWQHLQNATAAPEPASDIKIPKKIIKLKIRPARAEVAVPAIFLYTVSGFKLPSTDPER